MASPFYYYICPDCGIDIKIVNDDEALEKNLKPTDLRTPRKYSISETILRDKILEYDSIAKLNQRDGISEGNLSPLSPITLPPHSMKNAGIPTDARYYAYMNPPHDLSDIFDYDAILQKLNRIGILQYPGDHEYVSQRWTMVRNVVSFNSNDDDDTNQEIGRKSPPLTLQEYKYFATSNFAVFGGFAYFNENYDLLRVNALSTKKTDYRLHLSGPYETTDEVSKTMIDLSRSDPISLKLVQEAGFVAKSFVRPGEMFRGKYVVNEKLSAHGAFVYHRDNGTSMVYVVARGTQQNFVDDEIHTFQSLADCHNSIPLVDKFEFSKVFVRHDDFDECVERVLRFVQQKEKPSLDDIDGFPLLHQALKVQCPLDEIKSIVDTYGFKDKKDTFGWSALHYACRFNADNLELIAWLLSKDALNTADHLGRYPLHLACDSSPSYEVVSFLLHVSKCNGDNLVSRPTSILKRLPLHIACDAGATTAVIEALLKADGIGTQKESGPRVDDSTNLFLSEYDKMIEGGSSQLTELIADWKVVKSTDEDDAVEVKKSSLSKTTLVGRTALHLAINKRLPPETIELLLNGDSTVVHKWYRGMLPLHMAIMNHYGEEIIKLLMAKDKEGTTLMNCLQFTNPPSFGFNSVLMISTTSGGETQDGGKPLRARTREAKDSEYDFIFNDNLKCFDSKPSSDDQIDTVETETLVSKFSQRSLTGYTKHLHGIRALHLCFLTRSMGAARLLLQREMRTKMKPEDKDSYASAIDQETRRTALHMACAINCEVDIIKLLCEADPSRKTVTTRDIHGSIPLHLACGHKDARYEVVKELLKADQAGRSKAGQPEVVDRLNRNSLARAIQSSAPIEVLAVLLEPMNVDVDCLDDRLIATLAGRIMKSGTLQTAVIENMAQRIPFALLLLQLAVNLLAVVTFLIHIEGIFSGEKGYSWTDYTLVFCLVFFFLRELIQMASEKIRYFFDAQNLFEFLNFFFLASSCNRSRLDYNFRKDHPWIPGVVLDSGDLDSSNFNNEYASMRVTLMLTAIVLIVNFIVSLRSAFLPFARFVGGLQIIILTLLPFFIVTGAILIAFSITYRIEFKIDNETDAILAINEAFIKQQLMDYDDVRDSLRFQCIHSFRLCVEKTLQAFFSGGDVDHWLDIVFGVVAIIILLNVVIAIVSDAWEDARDHATGIYWRGRIAFLSETSAVTQAPRNWRLLGLLNSCLKPLFKQIDNLKRISLEEPNFVWSKDYPYCLVNNKDAYDNPYHYLQRAEAEEIKNAKSFKSDLHWLNDSINAQLHPSDTPVMEENNGEAKHISTLKIQWLHACLWCNWFMRTVWYVVCLLIGLPCFGLWWPQPFRKYILSFGNLLEDGENEDETKEDDDSKLLREELKKLSYRIEALEGTNESSDMKKRKGQIDGTHDLGGNSMLSRASFRYSVNARTSISRGSKVYN